MPRTKNVATATNAANGGVAILTKTGTPAQKAVGDADAAILRDQGRWEEVLHALEKGNKHLKVASIYGYDGAATDGERFRLNEDLICRALVKLLETGDTPYLLCGDFNITPQQSPAIARLLARGILVDVPHAFGLGEQHTFCMHAIGQPLEGVEGEGRTRIDTILANKAAFPLITECRVRWDILLNDHAPIEVVMNTQRYEGEVITPKMQPPFPEAKWAAKDRKGKEQEIDKAWQTAWSEVGRKFCNAEERLDVEEMHRLWCKAAVQTLRAITDTEGANKS